MADLWHHICSDTPINYYNWKYLLLSFTNLNLFLLQIANYLAYLSVHSRAI